MSVESAFFMAFAVLALAGAAGLFAARHPVHGAASLLMTMLSLAGLHYLLAAPVAAVLQVMTYAGAIMMLIVFVIMVLNAGELPLGDISPLPVLALALPLLLVALERRLCVLLPADLPPAADGGVAGLARLLYGDGPYALAFELTGLALLAALAAAVLLAKKRLEPADRGAP